MGLFSIMTIGGMGMRAQRMRMETASTNLANANTTRTPDGGPYRRLDPVFKPVSLEEDGFNGILNKNVTRVGVEVEKVVQENSDPILIYDPSHPDANPDGYVAMPNVNVIEEMVNMMTAARSYEANMTSLTLANQMAQKALSLGK